MLYERLIAFIVTEVIKSKQEFDARLIDIELAFLFDSMSMINRTPRLLSAKNNVLLDRNISIS